MQLAYVQTSPNDIFCCTRNLGLRGFEPELCDTGAALDNQLNLQASRELVIKLAPSLLASLGFVQSNSGLRAPA